MYESAVKFLMWIWIEIPDLAGKKIHNTHGIEFVDV